MRHLVLPLLCACLLLSEGATSSNKSKRQTDLRELWRHTTFSSSNVLSGMSAQKPWGLEAMSAVNDPAGSSGRVLRVHYAAGSYTGTPERNRGAGFYSTPTSPRAAMMLSYDLYFSPNFDFVKGGKLPGLWGGAMQDCSAGRHSDNCFSTRFMWRAGGQGEVYAYISKDQASGFCDREDVRCNSNSGHSLGRGKWTFKKGQWQNIAQYVQLNTPGRTDGYIRVFLNGKKVYEITNISIRKRDTFNINGMFFSTFFGGGDSSWATPRSVYSYYRNFVLSLNSQRPVILN